MATEKYLGGIGARSGDELEQLKEYREARDKYEEGIAAISGSSPEERLKELEKIVADTEHDLERKKREHEHEERVLKRVLQYNKRDVVQLRSSLTASAPQQGIDSLRRSLPA
ncbi:PREDICTED: uncharacterized protein LOC105119452 [Populus euphratica]|uniref:Uncharacterized protein LOC105119452 n=1 Tax=Populus euphratica TaxID=75702 RepID=A0AAJ6TS11_POPEU|nr:PREDICTED: uncharacterized protein LOC105119452 [Populus euphratica]